MKSRSVASLSGKDLSLQAAAAASLPADANVEGEATIASSTFNLGKSIIGAGVLSIPSSIAFFSDSKFSLIPAGILSVLIGAMSAYSFSSIAKACSIHNVRSYQDAWAKSVDPNTGWVVSFATTSKCFLASLAYTIIIGDTFSALSKTFNLPAILQVRNNILITIATLVLLPLCSMKSLNALAPFSLLGLGGMIYTGVFMAIRYFDGSYFPGGKFYGHLTAATRPLFNTRPMSFTPAVFVLVSMLSTSYIAHYNAPRFLSELKNPTMERYNKMVGYAFLLACATYFFITAAGFLTFGKNSLGFLLNNYSNQDILATFARLAIGLGILSGFPFTFTACKDGMLDILRVPFEKRPQLMPALNIGLLTLTTSLALVLKDVSFVVGFSGALFGASIMYIFPALMTINNIKASMKEKSKGSPFGMPASTRQSLELYGNYGMTVVGVLFTIVGVTVSLLKEFKKM
eukprot:CAMPEP_0182428578 /NCGR_PEP_ID=MMETSP1167-20130531/23124_1 /TAXON_ID=2988 /ORGANISM="Mallomonas Sp, Strain CCMP3275" /LENGTH=458 /DNA_ID=CAMNT_0024611549 /DNA_START=199 /DNA_END=1575 /DNA_ORIENTATION=+